MDTSNKDRIYVALYARGGQDPNTYHWAIIIGPKNEVEGGRGFRYHARQRLDPARPGRHVWHYEALDIPLAQTSMLLARVMIGKVADGAQLAATLAAVPLVQDDLAWTCRIWVRDALPKMPMFCRFSLRARDIAPLILCERVVCWAFSEWPPYLGRM
jgi:hypothetical protein